MRFRARASVLVVLLAGFAAGEDRIEVVERDGRPVVLRLQPLSVRSPRFRLLVRGADGTIEEVAPPPPRTYRGIVEGEPETRVAASLLPEGLCATVIPKDGAAWTIRPAGQESVDAQPWICGDGIRVPPEERVISSTPAPSARLKMADPCAVKVADIAFDSDYEFYALKGGSSTDECVAIIEQGLAATNLIYVRDIGVLHRLSAILLHTDPATDFYAQFPDASDFGAMLVAFRQEWNANHGDIDRDMAYLLTAKSNPEYGGLAYVDVVCSSYAYGMGLGGWGYEGIFRHEIGHNWSAGHDCGSERAYIMCGNDIPAISYFNILKMIEHRDSRTCLDEATNESDPAPPFARPDPVSIVQGDGPIAIPGAANDTDGNCGALVLAACDVRSAFGAEIIPIDGLDPDATEHLLYLPRGDAAGLDAFGYTVADADGVERRGVALIDILPRALIAYYPLDEVAGTDAMDASGFDHEGDLEGGISFDANTVAGRFGEALRFLGAEDQRIVVDDDPDFDLRHGITVAAWFRADGLAAGGETLVAKGSSGWRLGRDGTRTALAFTCPGVPGGTIAGEMRIDDGAWHHAAGTYDGRTIALYVDGVLDRSSSAYGAIATNASDIDIGEAWDGPVDEVRIYSYGLSAAEVRALYDDARIENPDPIDGALGVVLGASLSWIPAPSATQHDVYVGIDRDAVAAATTASPEYAGRRASASYAPALERGERYFWRVDEVRGGVPQRGDVRSFATAFAYTDFREPGTNATSYVPSPAAQEIGFRTIWRATSGQDPFAGVISTGSTPTTPVFSHRSVDATTTFDAVDLSSRPGAALSLIVQVRDTGYEDEDSLAVYATDGAERIDLLRLEGDAPLQQREGRGYARCAARIPEAWERASLVVASSSDSSGASERYDIDRIAFFDDDARAAIARTRFREPSPGAASYSPGAGASELGFATTWTATGGQDPFAGVVEAGASRLARRLGLRSVSSTTTFATVDLAGASDVRATAVIRVRDTGYETGDLLRAYVTDGAARAMLVDAAGSAIEELATGEYIAFSASIPSDWIRAALVISTSSNSSAGSEGYDIAYVEFAAAGSGGPSSEVLFRRGDANGDGRFDIADAVGILDHIFGGVETSCADGLDMNDDGALDIGDPIWLLNHLFASGPAPADPFAACGADPTPDDLTCASYPACER
ncbi:MAG: hypothetical protein JXP34_09420 [Planctomycetes bacterium]|nr:hypothetical protein [Planctomycetota bacterium]